MIKAGIIGSTGYAGAELVRLLLGHKEVRIVWYGSRSYVGQNFSDIYGNLFKIVDDKCLDDNMAQLALRKKYALLLLGSLTTGNSLRSIAASVQYYGAYISGACAIFSAVDEVDGLKVTAAFHPDDVPEYTSYKPNECPLCQQGVPIDAIVNSFGYSELGRKADFY